jgi:hypothetical protein
MRSLPLRTSSCGVRPICAMASARACFFSRQKFADTCHCAMTLRRDEAPPHHLPLVPLAMASRSLRPPARFWAGAREARLSSRPSASRRRPQRRPPDRQTPRVAERGRACRSSMACSPSDPPGPLRSPSGLAAYSALSQRRIDQFSHVGFR